MSASRSPNCSVKEGLLKPTKLRFVIEYHFLKLNYFFRLLLTLDLSLDYSEIRPTRQRKGIRSLLKSP